MDIGWLNWAIKYSSTKMIAIKSQQENIKKYYSSTMSLYTHLKQIRNCLQTVRVTWVVNKVLSKMASILILYYTMIVVSKNNRNKMTIMEPKLQLHKHVHIVIYSRSKASLLTWCGFWSLFLEYLMCQCWCYQHWWLHIWHLTRIIVCTIFFNSNW